MNNMSNAAASGADGLKVAQPSAQAWDRFVLAQPKPHLLQLSAWGALKSRFGWQPHIIALTDKDEIIAGALTLRKRLPFNTGAMAYVPMGGCAAEPKLLAPLCQAIRQATGAAFLKLEPGFYSDSHPPDLASIGFQPSPQTIQPARTIIVDIATDDDTILSRMNQGARRKIRKSLARGIIYKEGSRADLPAFNRLMSETGARNAFGVHNAAYFDAVVELLMPQHGALLLAAHDGDLLAAIMVFAVADTAWYLYGASSRTKSNLYATYGIQWRAMQWAKRRGCRAYDFWGVPDHDETTLEAEFRHRKDGLWGVYGFKRGWGGAVTRSIGAWDLAWNPLVYTAYRASLKLKRLRQGGR